jgi:hypothetical protein
MTVFALTFFVFLGAVASLAIGVLFGERRIQGSCGGLATIPGVESDCGGICRSKGVSECPRRRRRQEQIASGQVSII